MTRPRVGILISGGGSNMVALLDSMTRDHPAEPAIVLSNRADAGGLAKAQARGVRTAVVDHREYPTREEFEAAMQEHLTAAGVDILCFAGFMRIVTERFAENWAGRMLNIHPSLLPKFKGLLTHARALEAGEVEHGCTVHEVTAALDDGPILGQARLGVEPGDTPDTLAARVLRLEHRLYPAVLARFATGNKEMITLEG